MPSSSLKLDVLVFRKSLTSLIVTSGMFVRLDRVESDTYSLMAPEGPAAKAKNLNIEWASSIVSATLRNPDTAPGPPALEPRGGSASEPPLGALLPDPRQGASSLDPHLCTTLCVVFLWPKRWTRPIEVK